MIDPAEVERYRLPEAENQRIFRERIVPDLLEGRAAQDTPTVVFLVGQPGAGKSKVTELVARTLNRHGGFVDVDSDLYKPYHSAYAALMAQDDTLMAAYTRADGRAWMARAEEYARTHHLHAIIQETSQNAQAVAEKLQTYRRAGARVEALFMGGAAGNEQPRLRQPVLRAARRPRPGAADRAGQRRRVVRRHPRPGRPRRP